MRCCSISLPSAACLSAIDMSFIFCFRSEYSALSWLYDFDAAFAFFSLATSSFAWFFISWLAALFFSRTIASSKASSLCACPSCLYAFSNVADVRAYSALALVASATLRLTSANSC